MEVYSCNIAQYITDEQFHKFLEVISLKKRERINKFHYFSDKKGSLFGELLLRYALIKTLGIDNDDIIIAVDENGKPYCEAPPMIHFNISHSGNWVVCVISSQPVGIDIEIIQEADLTIARKFFTAHEYNQISSSKETENESFYKFWTLKESYIKYKGKGLAIPLDSFEFTVENNIVKLKSIENENLFFVNQKFQHEYFLSLCYKNQEEKITISLIALEELNCVRNPCPR